MRDYARVQELAAGMIGDATRAVAGGVDAGGDALVVFNPVSWRRDGTVEVEADALPAGACLVDLDSGAVPHQVTGDGRLLVQVDGVPSCGYKTLRIEQGEPECESSLSVSVTAMENRFFRLELDDKGQISSLYDKRAGRQVLAPGSAGNVSNCSRTGRSTTTPGTSTATSRTRRGRSTASSRCASRRQGRSAAQSR